MLAEILKALHEHGVVFQAFIIGDGELRIELEGLLSRYDLTIKVQMLGSVSHQKWLDILVASDILLMPSEYEGISVALLEAMAAGVVPVVAKVGGQEEVVSSDAGFLIPHGDNEVRDYLVAIENLISSPGELQRRSKECKALAASKLSWDTMIDNFLAHVDLAHQFRVDQPRHPISLGFGRELASLSLEYKRLTEAVAWLWNGSSRSLTANSALPAPSAEAQAFAEAAVLFSHTWFGRMIVRSRLLRAAGKAVLKRMANAGTV
jgi:hypothetical protein